MKNQVLTILLQIQELINVGRDQLLGISHDIYAHFFIAMVCFALIWAWYNINKALFATIFLILSKEILDLGILFMQESIIASRVQDSLKDIFVGFFAVYLFYSVSNFRTGRPSKPTPSLQ